MAMLAGTLRSGVRAASRYAAAAIHLRSALRLPTSSEASQRSIVTSSVRDLHLLNTLRSDTEKQSAKQQDQAALQQNISKLVNSEKVVLFMKGTPSEPRCGFSRAAVMILEAHEVPFAAVNVLEDDSLREAVKSYSGWPTYPQCYVQGKLIGGTDILMELHKSREIVDELRKAGIESKFQYQSAEQKDAESSKTKK